MTNTWNTYVFKNSLNDFRSIENYIRLIQNQSSQVDSKQIFNHNFDRSRDKCDRLKFWKKKILKRRAILRKNSSKHSILWDEMFLKNTCIEPRSPKNKIFNQFSLNSQTSNTFCIIIKEFSILDGQNKITHNNMYKV